MSNRDSIHLISGDLLPWYMVDGKKDDPMLTDLNTTGLDQLKDYVKKASIEALCTLAITASSILALNISRERFSRRQFLKGGLALASVGSLALNLGRFSPIIQSYSTDFELEEVFQAITDITKPRFSDSRWLDGRTALVIAKTLNTIDDSDLPPGTPVSIVMGYPHTYEAGNLLNSKAARQQAIRGYAKELIEEIFPIATRLYYNPEFQSPTEWEQYVAEIIITFFSIVEVYEIKEPGVTYSPNPVETVQKLIKKEARFQSTEVKEALKDLGDAEKYYED